MSFGSAKKTTRRVQFVDRLMASLTSKKTFGTIGKTKSEQVIATYMHQTIRNDLSRIFRDMYPTYSEQATQAKADKALLWEGDKNTTVNHIQFLGAQHRPDYVVMFDGIRVGVELKRGDRGCILREALGQCLVYSSEYEFVCCVVADTTKDERIKRAFEQGEEEGKLLERLWEEFNVRIAVV